MLNSIKAVKVELEKTREELHCLVEEKGLHSKEIIVKSQKLDELINRYHQLTRDEKLIKQYRIA